MTAPSPLIPESRLLERVTELAARITADYSGRELDIVYAVNGASVFAPALAEAVRLPVRLHPIGFSAYPDASASGEVRITLDVAEPLHARHVLFVEGIIVSGRTPKYVGDILRLRQPASFAVCVLGIKPRFLAVDFPVAYAAFEFDKEIVVGFGVGEGPEKKLPFLAAR